MFKSKTHDLTLGASIRARRKHVGMTQADLASAIGVSFQQVQKYEKGITAISQLRMRQICEILNLPPDYFTQSEQMIGKPAMVSDAGSPSASVEEFLSSQDGQRLIEAYIRIADPKLRTSVLDFVASVAGRSDKDR